MEVGAHTIIVNYNESAVSGTPFTCKVYDAAKVGVSHLPRGAIGKSLQFVGGLRFVFWVILLKDVKEINDYL